MRSWLTDPAFAGSVSPYRSCFRRICFALPILLSPDLFRPTDPAFAGSVSPLPHSVLLARYHQRDRLSSAPPVDAEVAVQRPDQAIRVNFRHPDEAGVRK
jgi:hypothetical protein